MKGDEIDKIIQLMRTLNLAQIRKQLEWDKRQNAFRFQQFAEFFRDAKEQR